jgi:hypothetical protein
MGFLNFVKWLWKIFEKTRNVWDQIYKFWQTRKRLENNDMTIKGKITWRKEEKKKISALVSTKSWKSGSTQCWRKWRRHRGALLDEFTKTKRKWWENFLPFLPNSIAIENFFLFHFWEIFSAAKINKRNEKNKYYPSSMQFFHHPFVRKREREMIETEYHSVKSIIKKNYCIKKKNEQEKLFFYYFHSFVIQRMEKQIWFMMRLSYHSADEKITNKQTLLGLVVENN